MKYLKHWKLELFLSLASLVVIPSFYLLLGAFCAQILFVPLFFGLLALFLANRRKFLFLYPFGVIFSYLLFFLLVSGSISIDVGLGLIPLIAGSILLPTILGYLIGFASLKVLNPNHKLLVPIHILSTMLIVFFMATNSYADLAPTIFYYLSIYVFLPLVFMGSQAIISYLYPSNHFSPLLNALIYIAVSLFLTSKVNFYLLLFYLVLGYGCMYLFVKLSKQKPSHQA